MVRDYVVPGEYTGMGNRDRVQFPVRDIYLGM